jgi:ABC-type glycerol-3-phosphate transport system permease component
VTVPAGAHALRRLSRSWSVTAVLLIGAGIAIYPLIYTVMAAFKTRAEFASNRLGVPSQPTLQNFSQAFERLDIGRLFFNSFVTSIGGVVVTLVASLLAAYAVTKLRVPLRRTAFFLIVGTLLIPFQSIMYPLYDTMLAMGLIGQRLGLILAFGAFGLPFSTFLLAAYLGEIPDELLEAAKLDGATSIQILVRVILPLSVPALASLTILNFVWMWNDLLLPLLVVGGGDGKTLMVGVANFRGQYDVNIPLISAGISVAIVPAILVYLVGQRQLIKGVVAGAVR